MSTISFFGTLVDTVKIQYDLPDTLDAVAIPSPRSHTAGEDTIYRLTTKSKSYVLRHFRTESAEAIKLHNQFLKWAGVAKYPLTQRLIPTREKADFFEHAGRKWWLATFIEAEAVYQWTKPEWSHNDCQYAGTALSGFHETLRLFAKQEKLMSTSSVKSILPTLEVNLIKASANAPQFQEEMHGILRIVRKSLEVIRRGDKRRTQLIHGDFHPGNILYKDARVVAVIDFEYLHIEEPIYDVAYALIMFCPRWTDGADDGQIDIGLMQSFLRGYARLDDSLLLPYMRVAAAVCLTWLLEREADREMALHFMNILKQLQNFSTIDFSQASS